MNLGFHLRAWLLVLLASAALLLVVAIPPLYSANTNDRTVYVAVMIPAMSILYGVFLYLLLFRPLRHCSAVLYTSSGATQPPLALPASPHPHPTMFTKELHKLCVWVTAVTLWMQRFREIVAAHEDEQSRKEEEETKNAGQDGAMNGTAPRFVSTGASSAAAAAAVDRHEPLYQPTKSSSRGNDLNDEEEGSAEVIEGKVFYSLPPSPTD